MRDLLKPARPNPVGTFLVFLNLLERYSNGVRKRRLAQS